MQGKEPAHFIAIFGGLIVTLIGGAESGFHLSKNESNVETPPGGRLYQIRNNRVIEVFKTVTFPEQSIICVVICNSYKNFI